MVPLRRSAWPLALLVAILSVGPAPAQPSRAEIEQAVRDLGSRKFALREKASALLWSAGRTGELALLRGLRGADLETTRRADRVLTRFRWGIFPDTPKDALPLIEKYRVADPQTRAALLRQLFTGPKSYPLIARLLTAEATSGPHPPPVQEFLRRDVEQALRQRLRAHDFAGLEDLLEIRLTSSDEKAVRDFAVYLLLAGRIEPALEFYGGYAALPGHQREALVLAHLYRVKGDLAAARQAAEKARDPDLLQALLVEQGDWKALSALDGKLVGEDALPDFRAFYHRLAGNTAAFDRAVAELVKAARDKKPDDGTVWWEAKSLFLNDRTDDALGVLAHANDEAMIVDVLVRQRRFREAFRLLDRDRGKDVKERLWASLRRARLLKHLGESAAARKLLDGCRQEVVGRFDVPQHLLLVQAERAVGRGDEALTTCARLLEKWPPPESQQPANARTTPAQYADQVLRELFPQAENDARVWWAFLRGKEARPGFLGWSQPGETLATLQRLRAVLGGKLPKEDFAALVRAVRAAALKRPEAERDDWLGGLVETCRRTGRADLLRECLEAASGGGRSQGAFADLAKLLIARQHWAEAGEVCARGRQRHPEDPVLTLLHGHALTQLGRGQEGRQLEDAAQRLALADGALRHALGETLDGLGRRDDARRAFDLLSRSGQRSGWYTRDAWRRLSGYALADKEDLRAASCWERWYLGVIGRGSFFLQNEPYVWVPYRLHFLRARGLLAAGDAAGALAEIQVCQRLLPDEPDTALAFVPALARRGRTREADELFDRSLAAHRALCKEYPRCAWAHNGVAWLGARCRRQLDVALEHARQTVRLEPNNAGYLDTLAEVHFQRGERDEAIRHMRRCLELVPDRDYFRRQLKRFEAGDRSAEVMD